MDEQLVALLRRLPKVELHRHFEGSVRLATLVDIARAYPSEFAHYDEADLQAWVQVMPDDPRTSANFLSKFHTLRQFYRSCEIIERITYEIIEDAAHDGVHYMELRFTPKALCNLTHCAIHEIVALVCDAGNQAARHFGIQVRFIVSMNRHESLELGELALAAALEHRDKGIVGIDLAGDEANFPAIPFRDLFKRAKAAHFGLTVHAGEWDGANSVWDAAGNLGADRIGHGVRVIEDPAMLQMLVQRRVVLEVCPTSNVYSGIFDRLEHHPLRYLMQQGVLTTINTDDPLVCDITLSDELARAVSFIGLSLEDVKQATRCAIDASFLSDDERRDLARAFEGLLASV